MIGIIYQQKTSFFIAFIILFTVSFPQTIKALTLFGPVTEDATWTMADSPISVLSDVEIMPGVSVTVLQGVLFKVSTDQIFTVSGTFKILGSREHPVRFTSIHANPPLNAWQTLHFRDTASDATFDGDGSYLDGCILQHCIIEYAGPGLTIEGSAPYLDNCTLRLNVDDVNAGGLYVYQAPQIKIENCDFTSNAGENCGGVSVVQSEIIFRNNSITDNSGHGSVFSNVSGEVTGNSFNNNVGRGLVISSCYNTEISGNDFLGNGDGAIRCLNSSSPEIHDNYIIGNTAGGLFHIGQGGGIFSDNSSTPVITNNQICVNLAMSDGGGLFTASATVIGNNIVSNEALGWGGGAFFKTSPIIQGNNFLDNTAYYGNGIYFSTIGTPSITNNNLLNAGGYEVYNNSQNDVDLLYNWWGTTDPTEIEGKIYDKLDNPDKGLVSYSPFLSDIALDPPPLPPENLTGNPLHERVDLEWNPVSLADVTGYNVYYKVGERGHPYNGEDATQGRSPINVSDNTEISLTGLINGTTYYFAITAYDLSGFESYYSAEISLVPVPNTSTPTPTGWPSFTPSSTSTTTPTVTPTPSPTWGPKIYVDDDALGFMDGSKERPFNRISSALFFAEPGGEIMVAEGEYHEHITVVISNIKITGGYERSTWKRDPRNHPSIIDGDGFGVVISFQSLNDAVIDGFTIKEGETGVYFSYGSGAILNCIFTANTSGQYGGAIRIYSSSPRIENNLIYGNSVWGKGAGIYCDNFSSPALVNNTIVSNTAPIGAGIFCKGVSSPAIINNLVIGNIGGYGVYAEDEASDPIFYNNDVWDNGPGNYGGTLSDQTGTNDNISVDPLFVSGEGHNYYLSQVASGQTQDSPAIDVGKPHPWLAPILSFTTRRDGVPDLEPVDLGYHYYPVEPSTTYHRDNYRSGYFPYQAVGSPALNWSYLTASYIDGSPVVTGLDRIYYIGSYDGNFYCLNSDGSLLWSWHTGASIISSPAIDNSDGVYIGSDSNYFYAFYRDGSLRWSFQAGDGVNSSPLILPGGDIVVGSDDNRLYSLDSTGLLQWSYLTGGRIRTAPAIGTESTVYFGSDDGNFYAVSYGGELRWLYTVGDSIHSTPVTDLDKGIYFGSDDNYLYALRSDGSLRWSYRTGGKIVSTGALRKDGSIVTGSLDENVYCLSDDGTLIWSFCCGGKIYSSPVTDAGGRALVGSDDRNLYLIDSDGSFLWSFPAGNVIRSSPVISDDMILFGSRDGALYSIVQVTDTPTPSSTPTLTRTPTPTRSPTRSPTYTPSSTPTSTPTSTWFTGTPTSTYTLTLTPTDTPTASFTPTSTITSTPTSTPTITPTLTSTPSPTSIPYCRLMMVDGPNGFPGHDYCLIEWLTNRDADSLVEYGFTQSYGESMFLPQSTMLHRVMLENLSPGSIYHYRITSINAGEDQIISRDRTFSTKQTADNYEPVILEGPKITYLSDTNVILQWRTDDLVRVIINYGTSPGILDKQVEFDDYGNSGYSIIGSLLPDSNYYYQFTFEDKDGQTGTHPIFSFKTDASEQNKSGQGCPSYISSLKGRMAYAPTHRLPLTAQSSSISPSIVSGPILEDVGDTWARVSWISNEASAGIIRWGQESDNLKNILWTYGFEKKHVTVISSLEPEHDYHIQVSAVDLSGDESSPGNIVSLQTKDDSASGNPILITKPDISYLSDTMATIRWRTDKPSTTELYYGTDQSITEYLAVRGLTNSHEITLTKLLPNTEYYYQIESINNKVGAGLKPALPDYSPNNFTTLTTPDEDAPQFLNDPSATTLTSNSVILGVETDEDAEVMVRYSPEQPPLRIVTEEGFGKNHNLLIKGLIPETKYYYTMTARDLSMNITNLDKILNFTTESDPDILPPSFTQGPSWRFVTSSTIEFTWTTDEVSNSQLWIASNGSIHCYRGDTGLTKEHACYASHLDWGAQYQYGVSSADISGNLPSSVTGYFLSKYLHPPLVGLAGYFDTRLSTETGGSLLIIAFSTDEEIESIELAVNGVPVGVTLRDDGTEGDQSAGDGVFTLWIPEIGTGAASGQYLIEFLGIDRWDNQYFWPYLQSFPY